MYLCRVSLSATDTFRAVDGCRFEAVVVCDVFARCGEVVIDAISAGKHPFCDKPLCTRIAERP